MSLEMLTTTAAGSPRKASAAISSTTKEGAGNGRSFGALLDEQTGTAGELCPQSGGRPVGLGCERAAKTTHVASRSSLSALGSHVRASGSADPDATSQTAAAAADDDDGSADGERVDIVPVSLASAQPLPDPLAGGEAVWPGGAGSSDAGGEAVWPGGAGSSYAGGARPASSGQSGLADVPALPADATAVVSGVEPSSDLSDTAAPVDLETPGADVSVYTAGSATARGATQAPTTPDLPVVGEDLRRLIEAALRARIAETFPQTIAAAPSSEVPVPAQDAAGQLPAPGLADRQPLHDTASSARATVADAVAQAFGASADSGTASDQDGAGRQPLPNAADHAALSGARTALVTAPAVPFEAAVASADGAAASAGGVATIPNEANAASSIVQSMRMQMRDGIGTAVVHLEPDYLGPVTINLRVTGGTVTASLHAQNPQVRAWIEANESMLRQSLADQGLSLDRLLVNAEQASEDQQPAQGDRRPQDEPPARRQPKPDDSRTFEVIV